MGIGGTKYGENSNVYSNVRQFSSRRSDFDALGLTESDVGQIHGIFNFVDVDSSSEISPDEFVTFLEAEKTPFILSIFKLFDKDNNKKIDPCEFVISVWNFCTLTSENIAKFVFELYDKDDSGILDKNELKSILRDTYGIEYDKNPATRKFITKCEGITARHMDVEYFVQLSKKNSSLLFECCLLQSNMRSRVVGEIFWKRLEKNRVARFGPTFMAVDVILRLNGDATEIKKFYAKRDKRRAAAIARAREEAQQQEEKSEKDQIQSRRVSVIQHMYNGATRRASLLLKRPPSSSTPAGAATNSKSFKKSASMDSAIGRTKSGSNRKIWRSRYSKLW